MSLQTEVVVTVEFMRNEVVVVSYQITKTCVKSYQIGLETEMSFMVCENHIS